MDKAIIKRLADQIEQREDFKHTLCKDPKSENWEHHYHALEIMDKIMVLSIWCEENCTDNSREFHIADSDGSNLRNSNGVEDEVFRAYDDNKPFLDDEIEEEMVFIIERKADNSIVRGDKPEDTQKKKFYKVEWAGMSVRYVWARSEDEAIEMATQDMDTTAEEIPEDEVSEILKNEDKDMVMGTPE